MAHNAKEYLSQLKRLKLYIAQREEEITALELSMYRLGASGGEGSSGSRADSAAYTRIYEKLDVQKKRAAALIGEYEARKDLIISQIHQLKNPVHVELLYLRYVQDKPLSDVAEEMHYGYDYIRALHSKALDVFEKTHNITHNHTF